MRKVAAVQIGIGCVDAYIGKNMKPVPFQAVLIGLLVVDDGRIGTVQLHPYVSCHVVDIGQYVIPLRTVIRFAGKFFYLTVIVKYGIVIRRDKECFSVQGEKAVVDLGILHLYQCVTYL